MTQIEVHEDGVVVEAALIAAAFNLSPAEIQPLMRSGDITSKSETGVREDAGRSRLTFHYRDRAVRFVVDQSGAILKQSRFPIRDHPSIASEIFPTPNPASSKLPS